MTWGSPFAAVWNAATEAAKATAAAVATGAMAVGRAGAAASKWAAEKTMDAGKWAADETVAAAKWTETKVAQGVQMAETAAIAGTRGTEKTVGRGLLGVAEAVDDTGREIGKKVHTALDKVKSVFSHRKPAEPVEPCPVKSQPADVDLDGTLISYPGGNCGAVTAKGGKGWTGVDCKG